MDKVEIKNLSFSYGKKEIFKNINISVLENSFVSISGKNSCGKTTLIKLLSGNYLFDNIKIYDRTVNFENKEFINNCITIFSKENIFLSKNILDEVLIDCKNPNIYLVNKAKKIINKFGLQDKVNKPLSSLNYLERLKVTLIKAILKESKLLLLDDVFCYLDKYSKINFMELLKKYQIESKCIIISMISDLEDSLYSDRIILIDSGSILIDGNVDYVLSNESSIKKANLKMPLNYELLKKLKLYGLSDSNSLDINDMVINI